MALVRRSAGFHRYVFSVCYDGDHFLGISHLGPNGENCITKEGTDLRALHSVEGRIRSALTSLVGNGAGRDVNADYADGNYTRMSYGDDETDLDKEGMNYENFQVSSRTDRGVHALHNTFHVDIRTRDPNSSPCWKPQALVRGLNFYLVRNVENDLRLIEHGNVPPNMIRSSRNAVRITSSCLAPLELLPNKHYNSQLSDLDSSEPSHISWNARFTATSRTYIYRILVERLHGPNHDNIVQMAEYGFPFEAGKSWRIRCRGIIDTKGMKKAAAHLVGTHDFSSFRGKGCYRSSPVTNIEDIRINSCPLLPSLTLHNLDMPNDIDNNAHLITIAIKGNAFLYRQVRNIVGCLAEVGIGKLEPDQVKTILDAKDRRRAPHMAPAHGLFLANVEHSPQPKMIYNE